MAFNVIKKDNLDEYRLYDIIYNTSNDTIYYASSKAQLIELDNAVFKDTYNALEDIRPLQNKVYVVLENSSVYGYYNNTYVKLKTEQQLLSVCASASEMIHSTIERNGYGYAPLTMAQLVTTEDGLVSIQDILDGLDNISQLNTYTSAARYAEAVTDRQKEYKVPFPIANFDLNSSYIYVVYKHKLLDSTCDYIIRDHDFILSDEIAETVKDNDLFLFIFLYYRSIDMGSIIITKNNLSNEMAIEWERFLDHIDDTNNPHRVNKDQVGLGNVYNYGVATVQEATEGLVSNKYMTPFSTAIALRELQASGTIKYDSYFIQTSTHVYTIPVKNIRTYTIPEIMYDPMICVVELYINGLKLLETIDYTIEGNNITLLINTEVGDNIAHVISKIVPNSQTKTPVLLPVASYVFTADTNNRNTFALPTSQYNMNSKVDLYYEGLLMIENVDYTIEDNIVELTEDIDIGAHIYAFIYSTSVKYSDLVEAPAVINSLVSNSDKNALSAYQGRLLNEKINSLQEEINALKESMRVLMK